MHLKTLQNTKSSLPLATPTKGTQQQVGFGSDLSPIGQSEESAMITGSGRRTRNAAVLLDNTPLIQRELAIMKVQVARERRQLASLQETHNDLLALLAQEEVEVAIYRDILHAKAGASAVKEASEAAQIAVTEKYGSYVDLRGGDIQDNATVSYTHLTLPTN